MNQVEVDGSLQTVVQASKLHHVVKPVKGVAAKPVLDRKEMHVIRERGGKIYILRHNKQGVAPLGKPFDEAIRYQAVTMRLMIGEHPRAVRDENIQSLTQVAPSVADFQLTSLSFWGPVCLQRHLRFNLDQGTGLSN